MFEMIVVGLGAIASIVMAVLKLTDRIDLSWWWVAAPVLIGILIALIKNGFDLSDLLLFD